MYHRYWNLRRRPFDAEHGRGTSWLSSSQTGALVKLRYLTAHRPAAAMLIGPGGTGKTYLARTWREELAASGGPAVTLAFPQLPPLELMTYFLQRLGDSACTTGMAGVTTRPGLGTLLHQFEQRLRQLTEAGTPPCLVLEDAHLVRDPQTFEVLQQLLNLQAAHELDFLLLLVGNPELAGLVEQSHQLEDRLLLTAVVEPLSPDETRDYIEHQLTSIGGAPQLFSNEAVVELHRLSLGQLRRINRLSDFALLLGYAEQSHCITGEHILAVARELGVSRAA